VVVATARLGSLPDQGEYVGNVRAMVEIVVRARVRGDLLEKHFQDGQLVSQGDLLYRIDPSTYQVALSEAKGELAVARAEERRTELDFDRAQRLSADDVVSQSFLDTGRAQRDAARARVASAAAAVRAAELDLSYCTVSAPIDGRIGRGLVDVGNLVGASGEDTVLARIVQIDPIHVYFAPTELEKRGRFRATSTGSTPDAGEVGVAVSVRLGDGTTYPHPGVVDYVDPTIDPTRGTVTVRARVPNPDAVLEPGEFVRVVALFPDVTDAVLVPQRGILDEQAGVYVLVLKDDDSLEHRSVKPGAVHDGLQHIVEGLAPGERIVVDGVQKARPGQKVVARPLPSD
jgi:membrane fusion protein (multidrug efflux system)